MKKLNQKGFSAVEGLLILVFLLLIGVGGWYIKDKRSDKAKTDTSNSQTTTPTTPKADEVAVPEGTTNTVELGDITFVVNKVDQVADYTRKLCDSAYYASILGNRTCDIQTKTVNPEGYAAIYKTANGAEPTADDALIKVSVVKSDISLTELKKNVQENDLSVKLTDTTVGGHSGFKIYDDNADNIDQNTYLQVKPGLYVFLEGRFNTDHINGGSTHQKADYTKYLPNLQAIAESVKLK